MKLPGNLQQLTNERDNAAAHGDTARAAKLDRLLGASAARAAAAVTPDAAPIGRRARARQETTVREADE